MKMSKEEFNALHLWFRWVAQALKEKDIEFNEVIKAMNNMSLTPTDSLVKEVMWRPVQMALFHIESTTNIGPKEVNVILEHLNRLLANLDEPVHVPFPNKEELVREEADRRFYSE